MNFILKLVFIASTSYLLKSVIPGVQIDSFLTAIIFALVLSLMNITLKPLLKIFGFPLTILSLGLFLLVINTLVVLAADYFVVDMHIANFRTAFVFSVLLSFIVWVLESLFTSKK